MKLCLQDIVFVNESFIIVSIGEFYFRNSMNKLVDLAPQDL